MDIIFFMYQFLKKDIFLPYILTSWSVGFYLKGNIKNKNNFVYKDKIFRKLSLYKDIIFYHKLKLLEIIILLITFLLFLVILIKNFLDILNQQNSLIGIVNFYGVILFVFYTILIIGFLLIIYYVLKEIKKDLLRTLLLTDLLRTLLLTLGILPRNIKYYINIQNLIYFLYILNNLLILTNLLVELYLLKNKADILRDGILFILGSLLLFLPFYFLIYTFLEKLFFPKVEIKTVKNKKDFERYISSFYLEELKKGVRNYYASILIPSIIEKIYNKYNYNLIEEIETLLKRTTQYYLAKRYPVHFFHVEQITAYTFMLLIFAIVFIFMFTLKDFLETINLFKENLKDVRKEIISIIIIAVFVPWSLFFIRLQIYLFPHHLWSHLSDKIKQINILDNIRILFFSIDKGKEEINPYQITKFNIKTEKRLDLTITIVSSIIITIILSILLSQIE